MRRWRHCFQGLLLSALFPSVQCGTDTNACGAAAREALCTCTECQITLNAGVHITFHESVGAAKVLA